MLGRSFSSLMRSKLLIILFLAMILILYTFDSVHNSSTPFTSSEDKTAATNVLNHTDQEQGLVRPIELGFSQLGSESAWRNANTISIREAAEEAGIKLHFEDADQSQSKQFEAIRSFIKQKWMLSRLHLLSSQVGNRF